MFDHTDFGSTKQVTGSMTRTFTIANTGSGDLVLTGVSPNHVAISGLHAADFTVTTQPASPVVKNTGVQNFTIEFTPSQLGLRQAIVTIASNDVRQPIYTFAIQGTATAVDEPEIELRGNGIVIVNGNTSPNTLDHTHFGNVNLDGATAIRTFVIGNHGSSALNLTGSPKIQLIGHTSDFSVTADPVSPVSASGGTTSFTLQFDPTQMGTRQATVTIASNDSDEGAFTFDIQGFCEAFDFGDAPPPYRTTLAQNGPRHQATGPRLGDNRDAESDVLPTANADGDDTTGTNDEDGVTFTSLRVGQLGATVVVNVQNAPAGAKLDAWIDFNKDGTFNGIQEQIAASKPVVNGDNDIAFDVPSWAVAGNTFARFRLSTSGGLSPIGPASHGEVEDHMLTIEASLPGLGSFDTHIVSTAANGVAFVTAVDLDQDGHMDLVSANPANNEIAWYRNNGNQSFSKSVISTSVTNVKSLAVADLNGDGHLDIIAGSDRRASNPGTLWWDSIYWFENNGSQNFTGRSVVSSADGIVRGVSAVVVIDIDNDGDLDVITAGRDINADRGEIYLSENLGGGVFQTRLITNAAPGVMDLTAADIDGDGDLDLIAASFADHDSKDNDVTDGVVRWYENVGANGFIARIVDSDAKGATSVVVADIDGDGNMDIVSTHSVSNQVVWYQNNGNQSFVKKVVATDATNAQRVFTADLNAEGHIDIITASRDDNKIVWFKNDEGQNFTAIEVDATANGPMSVFVADINGDGVLNIISASANDNRIAWYSRIGLRNIETSVLSYTEDDAAVQPTNTITVSDADSPNMASATVTISGNYANGQDELSTTGLPSGITASFDVGTGTLTLSGSASQADYQTALRAIRYRYANTSNDPNTSTRTVSFQVNDGAAASNVLTRQITVVPVNEFNHAPILDTSVPPILTSIDQNTTDPAGDAVGEIVVDGSISDPDVTEFSYFQEGSISAGGENYTTDAVTVRQWTGSNFLGNVNQNDSNQILIGFNEAGGDEATQIETMRGLIEFDITALKNSLGSADFVIDDVSLVLRTASTGGVKSGTGLSTPFSVDIYEYDHDIDEGTATWIAPSANDSTAGGTHTTLLSSSASFDPTVTNLPIMIGNSIAFRQAIESALNGDGILRLLLRAPETVETLTRASGYDALFASLVAESDAAAQNRPRLNISLSATEAIAVTGVDNSNGTWQFSTNAGTNWSDFGNPSTTASRLLESSHLIRFVPTLGFNGTATFTYRAWDQTTGTSAGTADTSVNGGSTAFSESIATATITVVAINVPETRVEINASGGLQIEDINGADSDDNLTIAVSEDGLRIRVVDPDNEIELGTVAMNAGAIQIDANMVEIPVTAINAIVVDTRGGNDLLTLQLGPHPFTIPISYTGNVTNPISNSLALSGTEAFTAALFSFLSLASGTIELTGNSTISYASVGPISSGISTANVTLDYASAAETISLTDAGSGKTIATSTAAPATSFMNPTGNLVVNAGQVADDIINIDSLADAYSANIIIDGQGGVDTVNWNGSISLAAGKSLSVNAEMIHLPLSASSVSTSGTGQVELIADRSIAFAPGASLTTVNGGITLLANTAGNNIINSTGVTIDSATITTLGNGDILIDGTAGGVAPNQHGVVVIGSSIVSSASSLASAGKITISGQGGSGSDSDGIRVVGASSSTPTPRPVVRSHSGNIVLNGSTDNDSGVVVANFGLVESVGTEAVESGPPAAGITINGSAGTANTGSGVAVGLSGSVASTDGDIQIDATGIGGLRGVYLFDSGTVRSIGTTSDAAKISIVGTAGSDDAVKLGGAQISSVAGNIDIKGTADPGGLSGVTLFQDAIVQVGSGSLNVTGTGGNAAGGPNAGVRLSESSRGSLLSTTGDITVVSMVGAILSGGSGANTSIIGGASASGTITLIADEISLNGGAIKSTGPLTIQPLGDSTSIGLGGGARTLNITDAELSTLTPGFSTITIGNLATGSGVIHVDTVTLSDPVILAGGRIHDAATGIDLTAPMLTLAATLAPGQSPGVFSVHGNVTLAPGERFEVEIGGTTPGSSPTNHDQLLATGSVTIGADAVLSLQSFGGFTPTH